MDVILFDLDDTLFDHKYCSRAGVAALQERYAGRIDESIDDLDADYRHLLEQLHKKVLDGSLSLEDARIERFRALLSSRRIVATADEVQAAARCYRESYDAAYRAVPGAIELLERIRAKHPIGIVTNHVVVEQVKKIGLIGVEPFIDALVVSEQVGVAKPDSKIFEAALSQLGGTPEEAVMIGDSWSSDILGAAKLN